MTKQDLRIVYLGTPEFAVASLRALVEGGYNVVAVVTMPDKPAGRGHQLQYSDVKKYALEVGLPVLQPEKLKDEAFVEELRSYQADLQIVVAFRMLPEVVWAMPRLGTFNIHGSLLPQYRGAAPIETGLTTFMLKHEIDTGNMILQERIAIGEEENVGSVHDRLMALSESMVIRTVDLIIDCENKGIQVPTTPQPEIAELKPAPKIFKEDCEIRFAEKTIRFAEKTAQEVKNFVRGLSPYPAAWANLTIHGQTFENVKIFAVEIADKGELVVPCKEGTVSIKELQVPGKKRMDIKAFLNGLKPLPCPPLKGGSQER